MPSRRLLLVALVALVACATDPGVNARKSDATHVSVAPTVPPSTTSPPGAGTDGVGDALFPELGNPGLDVLHYDVDLAFDPATDLLQGTVGLDLALTMDRTEITLDAAGPEVNAVTVDGAAAQFVADDPELRVTLPEVGRAGDELRIEVAYQLTPGSSTSTIGLDNGWFDTPGGSYVLNEPDAARTWLPCNDHPSDKASYTFTITVPTGLTAVANGDLTDHRTADGREVWVWNESRPMATYLVQLFTGDYEIVQSTGPHGLPLLSVVLRPDLIAAQPSLDLMAPQIEFFEQYFGPYPLDRYGIAITDSYEGLAMETQERSYFSRLDVLGSVEHLLLSHELAHQWFGDAVTPSRWSDIWLNESFATYGQWLWLEHINEQSVENAALQALGSRPAGSTAEPLMGDMFGFNSYEGGAVVLHALRKTIGDEAFFTLLQRWVSENNGRSVTTQDFIALAEKVSGQPLTDFFDTWLFSSRPPIQFPQ